jgi:hypothetical protein
MQGSNTYLKRGKGKNTGNIKKNAFFVFYKANAKESVVDKKLYNSFLKELLETFSAAIIKEGLELKINKIGKLRIKSSPLKFLKKNGELSKSLKVNWQATWNNWQNKYPELTKEEITKITNKKVIYHENEHSNQEFYSYYWDKLTITLKYKTFYNFKASRQYLRLIAQVVKDPNRKIFYYG